jgi:hypothetical protein
VLYFHQTYHKLKKLWNFRNDRYGTQSFTEKALWNEIYSKFPNLILFDYKPTVFKILILDNE